MNELKPNMYVRTNEGKITKIIEIDKDGFERFDKLVDFTNYEIIKTSFNIIDLIEVGDYVNGRKVLSIHCDDGFDLYLVLDGGGSCDGMPQNRDIKSIVTKEQFLQMEYKVEQ